MKSVRKLALAMGLVAMVGCGVADLQGPQGPDGAPGAQGPAGTSSVTDVQTARFFGNIHLEGSEELRIPFSGFMTPDDRITVTRRSWVLLDASMGFRKFVGTVGVACTMELLADDEVTQVSIDNHEASVFMMNEEAASGDVDMRTDGTISLHSWADLEPGRYVPVARCSILPGTTDKLALGESWLRVVISSR
ncbi:collagen-like protein [Archangium gephyra]|nr:collagen-like protein [Archangium gephyra]